MQIKKKEGIDQVDLGMKGQESSTKQVRKEQDRVKVSGAAGLARVKSTKRHLSEVGAEGLA